GGVSGNTASALSVGTYIVSIVDANGCSTTQTVNITDIGGLTASSTVNIHPLCNGDVNGAIDVSIIGGTANYDIDWGDTPAVISGNTYTIPNLAAGIYDITVTDVNGCQDITTTTLIENAVVTASASLVDNVTCFGDSDGSAIVTPGGGDGNYTYLWSNAQTTATATGLAAGTYTVTVYDGNMCEATSSVTITENPAVTANVNASVNVTCNGNSDGSAIVTPGGGDGNYTYLWNNTQTTATATNLAAGTYTVTVYDGNMCEATTTITITENPVVTANINTSVDVTCNGDSNGSATVTPSGGTGTYTYLWSNGQTSATATNLSGGLYTVTVYDGNNCQTTASVTIIEHPEVTASITSYTDATIAGVCDGSATVTPGGGDGNYTYLWNDTQNTSTATGLCAGTHTVTVYDGNGCSAVATVTIIEPDALTLSIVGTDVICNGNCDGTSTVTPTGGVAPYTYSWSNTQTSPIATNLCPGTYIVTVRDVNGAQETASITISQNPVVTATISNNVNVTCNGGSDGAATVIPGGGTGTYTYSWSNGQTTATITNLIAGTYTVTVYDGNMCEAIASIDITQYPTLTASINSTVNVTCNGGSDGSATVTPVGGTGSYTYLWSNTQTTATANNLSAGPYTVTVYDGNLCQATATVNITEYPAVSASITNSNNVTCNGNSDGSATVFATGGTGTYTYFWSNTQATATLTNVPAGTYYVTVTDGNNCEFTLETTITQPEPLGLTLNISNMVSCNGFTDGSITATCIGGTPNYTYQWNDPANSSSPFINGLSADTYSCVVTDANSCTLSETVTITEPSSLSMTISVDSATCYGDSNGSAFAYVSGGTMPVGGYNYLWNDQNNSITSSISFVPAGSYTLLVTDQNGCQISENVQIHQPPQLNVSCNATPVVCEVTLGSVLATATGGNGEFSYWWSNGDNQPQINNLTEGTYEVTVTDVKGCTAVNSANVHIQGFINLTISETHPISCFGDEDGALLVEAPAAANPIDYLWSNTYTTEIISNIGTGFYTVSA
ncbi:MAG: SprB repeat-containing protein, partial [Bacteroidales bacterium]|nr:SprB repeat-containing protein [Bacteroidales bacterium]